MKKSKLDAFLNYIKSLEFVTFVVVLIVIIVPVITIGTIFLNVSTSKYYNNRLEEYKSNNIMLKNNIISSGFLDKKQSEAVKAQINLLSNEFDARIQIIDTSNIIREDTKSSSIAISQIKRSFFSHQTISMPQKYTIPSLCRTPRMRPWTRMSCHRDTPSGAVCMTWLNINSN